MCRRGHLGAEVASVHLSSCSLGSSGLLTSPVNTCNDRHLLAFCPPSPVCRAPCCAFCCFPEPPAHLFSSTCCYLRCIYLFERQSNRQRRQIFCLQAHSQNACKSLDCNRDGPYHPCGDPCGSPGFGLAQHTKAVRAHILVHFPVVTPHVTAGSAGTSWNFSPDLSHGWQGPVS